MGSGNRLKDTRVTLTLTFGLLVMAGYQLTEQANELGILFVSRRWTGILALIITGMVLVLALLLLSWTSLWIRVNQIFLSGLQILAKLCWGNLFLILFSTVIFSWLLLGPFGYLFENYFVRLCLFWLLILAGAGFIRAFLMSSSKMMGKFENVSWFWLIVSVWIFAGFGYQLAVMVPSISTYPFSIGWSETSRYYYASLYFAKEVYGIEVIPSVLHPSRYLLQAIPFIVSGLPLWFHRLWQVLIWVMTTLFTVYLLSNRLSLPSKKIKSALVLFMAWAYLFLFQGPVYYHLLVCVILVLWGFDSDKFWRSLIIVILASTWAGISRINWFPVPGLLAATIYFLEIEIQQPESGGGKVIWEEIILYLLKPVIWVVVGTLVAFGSQVLYVYWSGAELGEFTSSFTSELLWYRLFPNPTFPLGILPAVILISTPLVVLIVKSILGLHPLRLLGIGSTIFVLLVGGVIVSTKIGGGSNLHNLDAYLVILLVIGGYVYFDKVVWESNRIHTTMNLSRVLMFLIVLVPVMYALSFGGPLNLPEKKVVELTLESLDEITSAAVNRGGDVLFITERQLLTFEILKEIPLVEKFETVFLMEMAMSGNENYLNDFHENLSKQNYTLIITDQQRINYKGREFAFGEENDVWVAQVTVPLLKNYQREILFKDIGIEVLIPKE